MKPEFETSFCRKTFRSVLTFTSLIFIVGFFQICIFGQSQNQATSSQPPTNTVEQAESKNLKIFALRLTPGQDLRKELEKFAKEHNLKSGFIMTAVGSLNKASLRLADQSDASSFAGKFEIVSLVGTLSPDGVHLHISLSDSTGKTIGGHLVEGCEIYTTAEIVVGEAEEIAFTRETDKTTGYKELKIRRRVSQKQKSKNRF